MKKFIKYLFIIVISLCFTYGCSFGSDKGGPVKYTVNYYLDNELVHTEQYEENSLIYPYEVTKEGYSISNYHIKGEPDNIWIFSGDNANLLVSDIELECESVPLTFTFILDYSDYKYSTLVSKEPETITFTYNSSYNIPDPLYKRKDFGWEMYFDGWLLDGEKIESTGIWNHLTSSDTLVASFKHRVDDDYLNHVYKFALLQDDTYQITGVKYSYNGYVYIPDTYNGKVVSCIDPYAFENESICAIHVSKNIKDINSLVFQDSSYCPEVITVDENNPVFTDCDGSNIVFERSSKKVIRGCLSSVIPEGVISFGSGSFAGLNDLSTITIPSTLSTIESGAFAGCESLSSIYLPASVTNIGDNAFYRCYNLIIYTSYAVKPSGWSDHFDAADEDCNVKVVYDIKSFIVHDGINYAETFSNTLYVIGITELKERIIIPETINGSTVVEIGSYAFSNLDITYISLPSTITKIGSYAFDHTDLTQIDFPSHLKVIEEYAFYCSKLKEVILPESLTTLGKYAFSSCFDLEELALPSHLEVIPFHAFSSCDSLISVVIPEGVKRIETGAFYTCDNLETITLPSTLEFIGTYAFGFAEKVTSLFVPENVTEIELYGLAFMPNCHFYIEADSKPDGWDNNWIYNSGDVTWGSNKPE